MNQQLFKILGNMKSKFERLANRQHLMRCAGIMHHWVREGSFEDKKEKLALYRSLGGDCKTEMADDAAAGMKAAALALNAVPGMLSSGPPTVLEVSGAWCA